mgnify:CR=1 FL=1|tara:strand:+ start:107765 stop:107911 length:147 start_codon:yes stop_codon:yes gene_type:complete
MKITHDFLYHLESEPSETKNLAAKNPEKLAELKVILEKARTESENFKF